MTITSLPQRPSDDSARVVVMAPPPGRLHWMVLWLSLAGIAWLYLHFAELMTTQSNHDLNEFGQRNFVARTVEGRTLPAQQKNQIQGLSEKFQHWFPHAAKDPDPPLLPWLVGESVEEVTGVSEMDIFQQGRKLNQQITLAFLIVFALFIGKYFSLLATINFTLVVGFGILLPRAIYFIPDPLYFCLFLLAFICGIQLLKCNSAWLHVCFGGICGLAYLTNRSIELLLASWLLVTGFRYLRGLFRKESDAPWNCSRQWIGLLGFAFAYIAIIGPYLSENKLVHGSYFHPFVSDWLMVGQPGMDAKIAVETHLQAHPWPEWWHAMSNGSNEALNRFISAEPAPASSGQGWNQVLSWLPIHFAAFGGLLLIAGIYASSRGRAWFKDGNAIPAESGSVVLFVLITLLMHMLAFALYKVPADRLNPLAVLFAPLAFCVLWAAESLQAWADRRGNGGKGFRLVYHLWQLAILSAICFQLHAVYVSPTFAPQLSF